MGCCNSTNSTPSSSPRLSATHIPATSVRSTNNALPNQPSNSNSSSIDLPAPTTRPNLPIQRPSPPPTSPSHILNISPPWTRSQLLREREAFFDTRVSGNEEVWKALRVVCEEVGRGEMSEAQAILDAMGVTCPTGKIASEGRSRRGRGGGLYDERGELYDIPSWVVVDPEDIVEDEDETEKDAGAGEGAESAAAEDDEEAVAQRRDEKGKGRAEDVGEIVRLRARLSDRGTDITVNVGMQQRTGEVVKLIRERIGEKRVRLMYLGKPLDERTKLADSAWVKGHVLNAMVFEGEESMLDKAAKKA